MMCFGMATKLIQMKNIYEQNTSLVDIDPSLVQAEFLKQREEVL